jgi:hypothetical protein
MTPAERLFLGTAADDAAALARDLAHLEQRLAAAAATLACHPGRQVDRLP